MQTPPPAVLEASGRLEDRCQADRLGIANSSTVCSYFPSRQAHTDSQWAASTAAHSSGCASEQNWNQTPAECGSGSEHQCVRGVSSQAFWCWLPDPVSSTDHCPVFIPDCQSFRPFLPPDHTSRPHEHASQFSTDVPDDPQSVPTSASTARCVILYHLPSLLTLLLHSQMPTLSCARCSTHLASLSSWRAAWQP